MFNAELGLVIVFGLVVAVSLSVGVATALGSLSHHKLAKAIKKADDDMNNRVG